jgi:hypothetical protein
MKSIMFAIAVGVALAVAGGSRAADETVVVPFGDNKPTVVSEKETVRINAAGISGSKIEVDVTGAAKVDKKTKIVKRTGDKDLIGVTEEEYDIKPTEKGKATVKVTITPPNGKAIVKTYEIEIK